MIRLKDVCKILPDGKRLLDGVSFEVSSGEFVGILGASGAGKSLTLRCLLGLTRPESGRIEFDAPDGATYRVDSLKGSRLRRVRRHLGVIFQGLHLVKRLTVLENVMIGRLGSIHPLRSLLYGFTDQEAKEALETLRKVGLADFAARKVGSLSGGEAQRVALARAMFQRPAVYLADEPISCLDPKNAKAVMELLAPLARRAPVVGVFHQPEMTRHYCTRVVAIKAGRVVYDGPPTLDKRQLAEIYGEELEEVAASEPTVERRAGSALVASAASEIG